MALPVGPTRVIPSSLERVKLLIKLDSPQTLTPAPESTMTLESVVGFPVLSSSKLFNTEEWGRPLPPFGLAVALGMPPFVSHSSVKRRASLSA